jgi:transcriptional regulator with XRE-family HTH domain
MRELRKKREWTQDQLADHLDVDRRQVVRLEAGRAPVTLEVVEALALAFGEISFVFMWSTVAIDNPYPEFDISWLRRLGQEEIRSHFGAALDRGLVASIVDKVVSLPDEDLQLLDQMASRMVRAIASEKEEEDFSFLLRPQRRRGPTGPPKGWGESKPS